jgi:acetyl/propionyl-CoA carboxylase alpha subunit
VDDGFEEGMDIPIYYDPMISKLISFGKDRNEAIERMVRAIDDYKIVGVETTLPFCKFVLQHEAFISGNFDTHFIKHYFKPEMLVKENDEEGTLAALFAARLVSGAKTQLNVEAGAETSSWKRNRTVK